MKQTLTFLLVFAFLFSCTACSASPPAPSAATESIAPASDAGSAAPTSGASSADAQASEAASQSVLQTGYPVTITDMDGFDSTIEAADRIISLTTSSTQILQAEGAEDRIVGVDAYSADLCPQAEVVGDYMGPDVEKIVSLEPDVVIAANTIQQESIDQLRSLGIPTVAAEPTAWDQVPESFELIGTIIDRPAEAQTLVEDLTVATAEVQAQAPAEPVTAYYVLSFGNAGNWTSGEGSFINSMMELAGGIPVTKDSPSPWLEYPLEDLVQDDPDCIILGSAAGTLEDFLKTPGYADLGAVKSGKVYEINSDLVTIPGPHLREGLVRISEILNAASAADAGVAA